MFGEFPVFQFLNGYESIAFEYLFEVLWFDRFISCLFTSKLFEQFIQKWHIFIDYTKALKLSSNNTT